MRSPIIKSAATSLFFLGHEPKGNGTILDLSKRTFPLTSAGAKPYFSLNNSERATLHI